MTARTNRIARLQVVGSDTDAASIRSTDTQSRLPKITGPEVEMFFMTSTEIRHQLLRAA